MLTTTSSHRIASAVAASLAVVLNLPAQNRVLSAERYVQPPAPIRAVLESPALRKQESMQNLGPDGKHFLLSISEGLAPLARFARPYVNLGETAIDHNAGRSRRLSTGTTIGYELFDHTTGKRRRIEVPKGTLVSGASWSPDGKRIGFFVHEDRASYLHVADVATGKSRRITSRPALLTLASSLRWSWDGKKILTVLVPGTRPPRPVRRDVAHEPAVWNSHTGKTPTRTYRFLLKSPHDERLLEWLGTGQLALVSVASGQVEDVGKPAMFTSADIAPDAKHFRVTTMQKPFSYFVPTRSFGTKEEIWNDAGKVVQLIRERKLRVGNSPRNRGGRSQANPKRSLSWRPDGKGMSFLQREPPAKKPKTKRKPDKGGTDKDATAKDKTAKGNPQRKLGAADTSARTPAAQAKQPPEKKKRKDRVMLWMPPYDDKSVQVVWESDDAIGGVQYSQDCKRIYVTQSKDGKREVFAVDLANPGVKRRVFQSKGTAPEAPRNIPARFRGRFGGGPSLLTKRTGAGASVVRESSDGKFAYLRGSDQPKNPETDVARAWIARVEIGSAKQTRVWEADKGPVSERVLAILDDDLAKLVVSRESRRDVPQSFLLDAKTKKLRRLTSNEDPAPEVTAARRMRFRVKRVDGFRFWVRVTVPRNHGQCLPALFWFYPREFTSQKAYDERARRGFNPHRFPTIRTRSMELLVKLGYVVVQPDCPIVGETGRMNDNYVQDLRNSLWAVIDDLDKRKIIDRDRLAIGGHSYGAFGTANAMIHTPFFKAGIAGDGNYNRTLTPMSFQSERRFLWDARETYTRMSPLLWANQLNGALLMYHGMDDNNSGTFPINSPRMFQVLDGLGKKTALYQYPYEGHAPRARESVHDVWARWVEWLDIHVKNPERGAGGKAKPRPADLTERR